MEKKYTKLIHLYLTQEITSEQQKELVDWLALSAENRQLFQEAEKLWHLANPAKPQTAPNLDESWNEVASTLNLKLAKEPAHIVSMPRKRNAPLRNVNWTGVFGFAVAAVFLFFILKNVLLEKKLIVCTSGQAQTIDLELPDHSEIKLNADSEISYRPVFSDSIRVVQLQGQAFFKITKDSRPFIVKTKHAEIKVMGTEFDVYSRNTKTEVIVKEGKVAFQNIARDSLNAVILTANERSFILADAPPIAVESVDAEYLIGWLNDRFVFYKTPLKEIIAEIQRRYDVKITISDNLSGMKSLTGSFNQQSIDSTMASFCLALNLNYSFEDEQYIISSN